jgi:hypothetical protein
MQGGRVVFKIVPLRGGRIHFSMSVDGREASTFVTAEDLRAFAAELATIGRENQN